jgi:transglutaminase-like putative cysteine protease
MLLNIRHETVYRYAVPATYSLQCLRLTPRGDGGQRVLHWKIDVPGRRWSQLDAYGNLVHVTSLVEKHSEVRVVAQGQVETLDERGVLLPHELAVPPLAFALPTRLSLPDAPIEAFTAKVLGASYGPEHASADALKDLVEAIYREVSYVQGVTDVHATAAEALEQRQGVCQDMAHVFLACCRARGIPARYVSGYLLTDATHAASHAWAEAWLPQAKGGAGAWLGFDITNNRLAGPELCRLAIGRDYTDASPIRGTHIGGAGEALSVHVAVQGSEAAADQ